MIKHIISILLFISSCVVAMQKPASSFKQESTNAASSPVYSDQDRLPIIEMVRTLKYGHLLFPIANALFKVSIKHALLDSADLLEESVQNLPARVLVSKALVNLSRMIKQSCPQKDFLASVEILIEQFDDRYEEEAKALLTKPDGLDKTLSRLLSYSVAHYETLTPKGINAMVHMHSPAPDVLQENLLAIPNGDIQKWYAEFMKDEQAS